MVLALTGARWPDVPCDGSNDASFDLAKMETCYGRIIQGDLCRKRKITNQANINLCCLCDSLGAVIGKAQKAVAGDVVAGKKVHNVLPPLQQATPHTAIAPRQAEAEAHLKNWDGLAKESHLGAGSVWHSMSADAVMKETVQRFKLYDLEKRGRITQLHVRDTLIAQVIA